MYVNSVTAELPPYPMEELTRIKNELKSRGQPIYDFGTGDPTIPTWEPIRKKLAEAIPTISQYPSVRGEPALKKSQLGYLERRFGFKPGPNFDILPTRGSKEAIFHIALSLVGRNGKKTIIYPNPGYPVYPTSTQFAGGRPYPVTLEEKHGFLLQPWDLPAEIQKDATAIWINYPHNPTGAIADESYWKKIVEWCHKQDCILLSDDCYIDIYDDSKPSNRPICPLQLTDDRVITFMSLSKRSGLTGYRSGFMAGDKRILVPHATARANFGLAMPDFVQAASIVAWDDDAHVDRRRQIFNQRLEAASPTLVRLGLLDRKPDATFYLWCRVPPRYQGDDIKFCLELAARGVITVPSQWLSEGISGYFRFALVPDIPEIQNAMSMVEEFMRKA
jgi:succinyldiaminopimelate transaminase